jgi:hypothetical protein
MDREELVGIQTIWWVDYQLAVGFLTGSWKSNMDVWISNQLFGNPTACLSWPRCNGVLPYEMMNYKWYQQVLGQYKAIMSGTWWY